MDKNMIIYKLKEATRLLGVQQLKEQASLDNSAPQDWVVKQMINHIIVEGILLEVIDELECGK